MRNCATGVTPFIIYDDRKPITEHQGTETIKVYEKRFSTLDFLSCIIIIFLFFDSNLKDKMNF